MRFPVACMRHSLLSRDLMFFLKTILTGLAVTMIGGAFVDKFCRRRHSKAELAGLRTAVEKMGQILEYAQDASFEME